MLTRRRIRNRLDPAQTTARESFFRAILEDDVDRVRELLKNREVSVNDRYRYFQRTGLHIAAQRGNIRLIRMLCLEYGAEMDDCVDSSGNTPFHYACGSADWNTVLELISVSPFVHLDTKNYYDETPLLTSCYRAVQDTKQQNADDPPSWEIARRLLPLTDNHITDSDGNSLLHIAARSENHQFATKLLEWTAGVQNPRLIDATNRFGQTPLHLASQWNTRFCRQLLLQNARVNAMDSNGKTPLHGAFVTPGSMRLLHNAGADVNAVVGLSSLGQSPLHYIIERASSFKNTTSRRQRKQDLARAKTLIQLGADVHLFNHRGFQPLHSAIERDVCPKLVNLLIREGHAGVNATTKNGDTPLHISARMPAEQGEQHHFTRQHGFEYKHRSLNLHELLSAGADVACLNANQLTPLQCAIKDNRRVAVKLFLEHSPSQASEMSDPRGNTLLHIACDQNPHQHHFQLNESIITMLLQAGASPNTRNDRGDTPLHQKVNAYLTSRTHRAENLKIVRLLLAHGASAGLKNLQRVSPLGQAAMQLCNGGSRASHSCLDLELLYILIKGQVGTEGHANLTFGV